MSSILDLQVDALDILNAAPNNYLVLLPDAPRFTIIAVSDNYLKATFTRREEIIGKGLFEVFPDNPQLEGANGVHNLSASLHHVLKYKTEHRMPDQRYDVPHPDKDRFVFKVWRSLSRPVLTATGEVKYIIHQVEDVTALVRAEEREVQIKSIEQAYEELKRAQYRQKESEQRFRTLANSIPQLAWMTDANGSIYWYNDRWYEYTGTTPEEVVGWGWQKVHHPEYVEGVIKGIKAAFDSGKAWEDTFPLRSKSGEYRWFLSRALPVRNEDGTMIGWFGTNTDITQQRQTEDALQKSEQQLFLAMEGGQLGYFDYDLRSGELHWSTRTKELYGLPPDTTITLDVYLQALHPDDRERTEAAFQAALDPNHGIYENEYRVIHQSDGTLRWIRSRGKAFFNADGKAIRLSGVIVDITSQKKAEHALQQSESNLRNLILQAPVAICIGTGPTFLIEVANDRMLEVLGLEAEKVIGHPVSEVLQDGGEQGVKSAIKKVYTTGDRFVANEMEIRLARNGHLESAYINILYEPVKNADGLVTKIIAVAIDVTDQVVARKKIEESHREFQFVMDFVPQMIWLARPDGYQYYYNRKWYDYTGLSISETEGDGWQRVYHPDDIEKTWQQWKRSLATGVPYEVEFRCRRHDGQYRWFLTRALPLKDEKGNIIKWFGTDTDIHDRKTFIEQLETLVAERTKELKQSNEHLQQFVHASSHDLKEPVRKIKFFANRLCDEASESLNEKSRTYLTKVQASAERMWGILEGVLRYSQVDYLDELYELIDLNEVIRNVQDDLEMPIQEKHAAIHYSDLPKLQGAPVMLHMVFYNLISNSLKFSKPGVAPAVAITADTVEQDGKAFARIEITDNGLGFEQQYAEQIFGTFTRLHTKEKFEGAGLGLSICRKIIERHGGSIVARSKENVGTTFEILLPKIADQDRSKLR